MEKFTEKFRQKDIEIKDGRINQRADRGFDLVAERFAEALGDRCAGADKAFLRKRLFLRNFYYLRELDLRYILENRFWERSYNLEIRSEVETDESFREVGDCLFTVDAKGWLRVRGVEWKYVRGSLSEEQRRQYVERLNHPLILDRVRTLDLSRVCVEHQAGSGKWLIRTGSILGSTTWVLIPPVLQTIQPKPAEFVKLAEFFDLTADAVVNNRSETQGELPS